MAMTPEEALAVIRQRESGNRNIYNVKHAANPTGYTASGYYQIIDPTWREGATRAGVDLSQYPTAISAPFDVQHQVAQAIYARYGAKPWASSIGNATGGKLSDVVDMTQAQPAPTAIPTPVAAAPAGPNPALQGALLDQMAQDNQQLSSIVSQATQPYQQYTKRAFGA